VDLWQYDTTPFVIMEEDQLIYNIWLADQAHLRNLSIGFSNDIEQAPYLVDYFDFTIIEQCYEYSECDYLDNFTTANKPVFGIEYTPSMNYCIDSIERGWNHIKKHEDLDIYRISCIEQDNIDIQISTLTSSQSAQMEDEMGNIIGSLQIPNGALSDNPSILSTLTLQSKYFITLKRASTEQYSLLLSPGVQLVSDIKVCLLPKTNGSQVCMVSPDGMGGWACIGNVTLENGLGCSIGRLLGLLAVDVPSSGMGPSQVVEDITWVVPVCIIAGIIVVLLVAVVYTFRKRTLLISYLDHL